MAPMTFGDKVNFYSMIGTWLGTFFTLFGLVAVITQLRALLKDFSKSRDETVKAAASIWAACLPRLQRSETGVIEGTVPSLRAWTHYYYKEGKTISVCPYERPSLSGRSSWSQLFCRLQIFPEDLINPAHHEGRTAPPLAVPTKADLLIDGSKISYGLPGEDFAAILLIGAFPPSDFDPEKTTHTSSHVGYMHLAAHSDPFSQVAQLDTYHWNKTNLVPSLKWSGRYADRLNVRHCLDIAMGILRFQCAQQPATFLFCSSEPDTKAETLLEAHPWRRPSWNQVRKIRQNLIKITAGSIEQDAIYDISKIAYPDLNQIFLGSSPWKETPYDTSLQLSPSQISSTLEIAFGLNSLKPWGLQAIIPQSIVNTFLPYLEHFLALKSPTKRSALALIRKFRELPSTAQHDVPYRTRDSMDAALDSLSETEIRGFLGLSSRCSLYYDAMICVFSNHGLSLEDVEIGLAAYCAVDFAVSPTAEMQTQRELRAFVRRCLRGSPMDEVEPWACEILATYMHAWLREAKDIKEDFLSNFRRRVFLG